MSRLNLAIRLGPLSGGGSSAPAFTPASLSPTLWLDPSDLTTMRQTGTRASPGAAAAVDSPVGLIMDKSGNNNDLVQATAAARPILRSAGGQFWLEFDGVDDQLASAAPVAISTTPLASLFVGLRSTSTAVGLPLELSANVNANDGTFYLSMNEAATGKYIVSAKATAGIDQVTSSAATYVGADAVLSTLFDLSQASATAKIIARADVTGGFASALDQADTSTNFSTQTLYLGARSGPAFPWAGRVHGLMFLGRTATPTERSNMETYLGAKQGRTL